MPNKVSRPSHTLQLHENPTQELHTNYSILSGSSISRKVIGMKEHMSVLYQNVHFFLKKAARYLCA